MGLRSSPLYYNLLMGRLFQNELLSGHMTSYLDDTVFYHETFEEHLRVMEQVCRRFNEANLRLHPKKCHFAASSLIYLGFKLSRDGIRIDKSRFQVLENYPSPKSLREIRSTVGLFSFFRRFTRGFSRIIEPIRRLLKQDQVFQWGRNRKTHSRNLKKQFYQMLF
jgi:hypothetical protein